MKPKPAEKSSFFESIDRFFQRKTVRGFARLVQTLEDLAVPVREALDPYLDRSDHDPTDQDTSDPVRMILNAPAQSILGAPQSTGWHLGRLLPWEITPNRVLVLTTKRLLVVSSPYLPETPAQIQARHLEYASEWAHVTTQPQVEAIPVEEILWLEMGSVLLVSWLEWVRAGEGGAEHQRVYFNSVSRNLFDTLAGDLRIAILSRQGLGLAAGDRGLDRLAHLPYRFKTAIPRFLLPGERVEAAVLRPSIWERGFPGIRRQAASRLVVVRTNWHFLLVSEDQPSHEDSYGLIVQFLPLPNVRHAGLEEMPAGPNLVVKLALGGTEVKLRQPFPAQYWENSLVI